MEILMAKLWNDCTPAEQEQRRINFGSAPSSLDRHTAWAAETVRRYQEGLPMTKDAKRDARRLIRERAV